MSFLIWHALIISVSLAVAFGLGFITGRTAMFKKTDGNN